MSNAEGYPTREDIQDTQILNLECETSDLRAAIAALKRQIEGWKQTTSPIEIRGQKG